MSSFSFIVVNGICVFKKLKWFEKVKKLDSIVFCYRYELVLLKICFDFIKYRDMYDLIEKFLAKYLMEICIDFVPYYCNSCL